MKIIAVFLLLTIPIAGFTQAEDSIGPRTKIKKAELQVGAVFKKEFITIYTFKPKSLISYYSDIKVEIINVTDAATLHTVSGLSISNSSNHTCFIDTDEIPGLLNFIDLLTKTDSTKPENYTEYVFNSRDAKIYGYFSDIMRKNSPSWHYGIKTDKYYSSSDGNVELKTLIQIKEAIINSRNKFTVKPSI